MYVRKVNVRGPQRAPGPEAKRLLGFLPEPPHHPQLRRPHSVHATRWESGEPLSHIDKHGFSDFTPRQPVWPILTSGILGELPWPVGNASSLGFNMQDFVLVLLLSLVLKQDT